MDLFTQATPPPQIEYGDIQRVNFSCLKVLVRTQSPKKYAYAIHQKPDTEALLFGRVLHCAVLEQGECFKRYRSIDLNDRPEKNKTMASTKNKKWKAQKYADSLEGGYQIIPSAWKAEITAMATSILSHPRAAEIIAACDRREHTILWEAEGIEMKSRIDLQRIGGAADIKTARDASERGFEAAVRKDMLHVQSPMYQDAAKVKEFEFIVVEKEAPYDVNVLSLDDEYEEYGRGAYKNALRTIAQCRKQFGSEFEPESWKKWPGYCFYQPHGTGIYKPRYL